MLLCCCAFSSWRLPCCPSAPSLLLFCLAGFAASASLHSRISLLLSGMRLPQCPSSPLPQHTHTHTLNFRAALLCSLCVLNSFPNSFHRQTPRPFQTHSPSMSLSAVCATALFSSTTHPSTHVDLDPHPPFCLAFTTLSHQFFASVKHHSLPYHLHPTNSTPAPPYVCVEDCLVCGCGCNMPD